MSLSDQDEPFFRPKSIWLPEKCRLCLEQYRNWVLENTSMARYMENALYVAPQFIPNRICESETSTEAGYAFVGLLHLYHESILMQAQNSGIDTPSRKHKLLRAVRIPLSIIGKAQFLLDLLCRKHGSDQTRWKMIILIESLKYVCKILLLWNEHNAHMLLQNGYYKTTELPRASRVPFLRAPVKASSEGNDNVVSTYPLDSSCTRILVQNPTIPVKTTRPRLLMMGELLHITRPLLFSILRSMNNDTSWSPAIVSFCCEIIGLLASIAALRSNLEKHTEQDCKAAQELSSRKMALLLYFLRDPLYQLATRPAAEKVCNTLDCTPILGRLARMAASGILDYYHRNHFYNSAS
uniref:Peroxisomal membrane protein PEX16 n=1 Tax=Albugo laibachii Nc14 TaxID=890382 RepID=F0X0E9_9STRA|nr:conserved hypothetical protein [Albugo laibachii Nc14]|eukprot:CCA27236.1 conserved hypothetical protein [Albugo laibachii Nc14]